jgi:hypothetical protein
MLTSRDFADAETLKAARERGERLGLRVSSWITSSRMNCGYRQSGGDTAHPDRLLLGVRVVSWIRYGNVRHG